MIAPQVHGVAGKCEFLLEENDCFGVNPLVAIASAEPLHSMYQILKVLGSHLFLTPKEKGHLSADAVKDIHASLLCIKLPNSFTRTFPRVLDKKGKATLSGWKGNTRAFGLAHFASFCRV
jgi:hypothetical protein